MFKILTLNKISKVGLGQLSDNYTVSDNETNPDGILLRSFRMHDGTSRIIKGCCTLWCWCK